jgi:hypothetical protein
MINRDTESFTQPKLSRRGALLAGGLGVAASLGGASMRSVSAQEATPTATIGEEPAEDGLAAEVIELFDALPGTKGLKFWAPPDAGRPEWSATVDADRQLVIASAFKAFVLAEYLRQAEDTLDPTAAAPLAAQLGEQLQEELPLDESVFTLGSPIFNPPNLTGKVTARTTLQAMILESDDTAADMMLKRIDAERVRGLISDLGLRQTRIPDSTRQYIGYVFGDPDWRTLTWARLLPLVQNTPYPPRFALNDEITMASTAGELVSFYARPARRALSLPRNSLRFPHHALIEGRDRPDLSARGQLVCQRGQPRRVLGSRALSRRWHVRGAALGLLRGDPQLVR